MNKANFFNNPTLLRTRLEKLFLAASPDTLRHLIHDIPEWKENKQIKENILDELDNLFAFGYEETRTYEHLQYLLPELSKAFSVELMLRNIEPSYVLNCLGRGACKWQVDQDNYVVDENINANAIGVARLFLTFFIDVENAEMKRLLQKDIMSEMRDCCIVGNWAFYEFLYGFIPTTDIVEVCHINCSAMTCCARRQCWIDQNWPTATKKQKT